LPEKSFATDSRNVPILPILSVKVSSLEKGEGEAANGSKLENVRDFGSYVRTGNPLGSTAAGTTFPG
jgi:hypothetical protein